MVAHRIELLAAVRNREFGVVILIAAAHGHSGGIGDNFGGHQLQQQQWVKQQQQRRRLAAVACSRVKNLKHVFSP